MLLNWTRLHDGLRQAGFALGFIALGAAGDSIYDKAGKLPWLHQQAAAVPALKGQVAEKNKEVVEKTKEVAEAHCERDLALNTTMIVLGADPAPAHCPEPKR